MEGTYARRLFTPRMGRHLGLHTPADVHYGRAEEIRARRGAVLLDAYAANPERFVRKIPTPPAIPAVAWINQPGKEAADSSN